MNKLAHVFTDKQYDIYRELMREDWFMAILYGAKRTGKTIFNNYMFLEELINVRKTADNLGIRNPQYILAGYSQGTIQKNVLEELTNMYNIEFKFDKHNRFKLFGVTVVQTAHGTIAGLGSIRGMTAFGAYINEASLANEIVFDEIKSRCSGEGARILTDTNPDHPEHWLLKDYIENNDESIKSFHFELDDNTFLSERYRRNIKNTTPSGMFYDRNILGLWVSGDGVVYSDFDLDQNTITQSQLDEIPMKEYFAGVDWGYEHYGSIVVIARDFKDNFYLIEEHAYQHKFIEEWIKIAKDIIDRYGNIYFYCDTARPEHTKDFKRNNILAKNADKSVLSGIEKVAKLFKTNKLFVVYENMERFKEEIFKYVWHKTSGEPIKENDDVLDSIRYAIYTHTKKSGTGFGRSD